MAPIGVKDVISSTPPPLAAPIFSRFALDSSLSVSGLADAVLELGCCNPPRAATYFFPFSVLVRFPSFSSSQALHSPLVLLQTRLQRVVLI